MYNLRREFNDYFSVLLRFLFLSFFFFFFLQPLTSPTMDIIYRSLAVSESETRRFFFLRERQSSRGSSRVERSILFLSCSVGNLDRDKRRLSDVLI